jgi:hypothetical protein
MISIYSQNGDVKYNAKEFILDSIEDLDKLEEYSKTSAPGSSAFIIATSEVYMLNNQREWVKI